MTQRRKLLDYPFAHRALSILAHAANEAQQGADLSIIRYEKGASNYLDLVTSQTAALLAQRRAIEVHTLRLNTAVALAHTLAGDGSQPRPEQFDRLKAKTLISRPISVALR